jgi:hypothetical protein
MALYVAPELLDTIIRALEHANPTTYRFHMLQCALVNRQWNRVAIPILWSTINLSIIPPGPHKRQRLPHVVPLDTLYSLTQIESRPSYGLPSSPGAVRRVGLELDTELRAARYQLAWDNPTLTHILHQIRPHALELVVTPRPREDWDVVRELLGQMQGWSVRHLVLGGNVDTYHPDVLSRVQGMARLNSGLCTLDLSGIVCKQFMQLVVFLPECPTSLHTLRLPLNIQEAARLLTCVQCKSLVRLYCDKLAQLPPENVGIALVILRDESPNLHGVFGMSPHGEYTIWAAK